MSLLQKPPDRIKNKAAVENIVSMEMHSVAVEFVGSKHIKILEISISQTGDNMQSLNHNYAM